MNLIFCLLRTGFLQATQAVKIKFEIDKKSSSKMKVCSIVYVQWRSFWLMNFNNNCIQKFPWVLIHLVKKLIPSNLPKLIERSLVAQLQISLSIIVQYGFKVTLFSYIFDSITRTIYLHSDPYSIIPFRKKIKKFL